LGCSTATTTAATEQRQLLADGSAGTAAKNLWNTAAFRVLLQQTPGSRVDRLPLPVHHRSLRRGADGSLFGPEDPRIGTPRLSRLGGTGDVGIAMNPAE
jgi:hypothetical protein